MNKPVFTMTTGDITRALGVGVTGERLQELGFAPVGRAKSAVLWDGNDFPKICDALTAAFKRAKERHEHDSAKDLV